MTGEGTHIKKFVSRYQLKKWVKFDALFSNHRWLPEYDILKYNQSIDDLSIDYALE